MIRSLPRSSALLFALVALFPAAGLAASDTPLPRERPAPVATGTDVPLPRQRPPAGDLPTSTQPPAPAGPDASAVAAPSSSEATAASASSSAVPQPPAASTPPLKSPRDYQVACPALMDGRVTGEKLPPIHEGQCGLQSPLALKAISANGRDIPLSETITTDCGMATALPDWVAEVDSYVAAHEKARIDRINVSTSYQCRNVDHAATGNLSFHAFADALDIIGFGLSDGRTISIAPGFNGTSQQGHDILHFARDAACTHFMTVLSPDGDSFHQDNMHLDLACHGKACTARLCE